MRQIVAHRADHVAEAVAAQMLAAIPARDDDQMAVKPLAFQHPQDDRACTRLAVVGLDPLAAQPSRPTVVGGLGKAADGFQFGQAGVAGPVTIWPSTVRSGIVICPDAE